MDPLIKTRTSFWIFRQALIPRDGRLTSGRARVAGHAFVIAVASIGKSRVICVISGERERAGERVGVEVSVPRRLLLTIGSARRRRSVTVTHIDDDDDDDASFRVGDFRFCLNVIHE